MEKYLRRCLDSLIIDEEGMKQLEVLVINDGSKDSSSQIAHEYQDKYPDTYRVIDKENGNYGSCINRGLKETTGKYVKVLDADDWFDNKSLMLFLSKISLDDVDLILSNCIIKNDDKVVGGFNLSHFKEGVLLCWDDISKYATSFQMHCVCYKTQMIRNINYVQSEGISYTDQQWVCLPMSTVKTVKYYGLPLYNYVVGREGQTMDIKVHNNKFKEEIKMVEQMLKWAVQSPNEQCNNEYIKDKVISFVLYQYINHMIDGVYDNTEFRNYANQLNEKHSWVYQKLRTVKLHPFINYLFIRRYHEDTVEHVPQRIKLSYLFIKRYVSPIIKSMRNVKSHYLKIKTY